MSNLEKSKSIANSIWLCRSEVWWWQNRVYWNYFLQAEKGDRVEKFNKMGIKANDYNIIETAANLYKGTHN